MYLSREQMQPTSPSGLVTACLSYWVLNCNSHNRSPFIVPSSVQAGVLCSIVGQAGERGLAAESISRPQSISNVLPEEHSAGTDLARHFSSGIVQSLWHQQWAAEITSCALPRPACTAVFSAGDIESSMLGPVERSLVTGRISSRAEDLFQLFDYDRIMRAFSLGIFRR